MFGGLGIPELIIILIVVLVIFGPKNLPKLGASIGKTVKNIREGMNSTDGAADTAKASEAPVAPAQEKVEATTPSDEA